MSDTPKTLLNEAQIRKFMKLASLQPLAEEFVTTSAPHIKETRNGVNPTPNLQSSRRGHGRGRGPEDRLEEDGYYRDDEDELESELHATEDELGDEDQFADEEAEELDDDADGGRMISVDDFLSALESALETAIGDEVEIDSTELEDENGDDEVEDVEMDMDLGIDDEEPLEESAFREPPSAAGGPNNHKGSKQHPDHRNKKNPKGGLASQGPGLVKEEDPPAPAPKKKDAKSHLDMIKNLPAPELPANGGAAEKALAASPAYAVSDRGDAATSMTRPGGDEGEAASIGPMPPRPSPPPPTRTVSKPKTKLKPPKEKVRAQRPAPKTSAEQAAEVDKSAEKKIQAAQPGRAKANENIGRREDYIEEQEGDDTDEIVEQITRRVAARILKAAILNRQTK